MRIVVRRYQNGDADAVERLNRRLVAGQSEHRLYREDLSVNPDADLDVRPVNDSLFVAADGSELRGGAWLREQYFWVDGVQHRLGWMKYPVSESLVDPQYAGVPASMVLQLLRQQPYLMGVGMGGHEGPFARLLAKVSWTASTVPFLFKILRPYRVLRGLTYARRRWWLKAAMDAAAWSGAGWAAHRLYSAFHREREDPALGMTEEARFSPWADDVWEACRDGYAAVAVRDGKTLDFTYPPGLPNVRRLRISRAGHDIGWACVQTLPPTAGQTAYFGSLEVGLINDAFSLPSDAGAVLQAGIARLRELGTDMVITYVSHVSWVEAARRLGFLSGPSTLALYRSPKAEQLLVASGTQGTRCHFTRADGHGPA